MTWFIAKSDPVTAKKRWISGQLVPNGQVFLDAGAEKALLSGKSLLPAGVTRIDGSFDRGDAVIISVGGRARARPRPCCLCGGRRAAYHRKRSSEIAAILGFEGRSRSFTGTTWR